MRRIRRLAASTAALALACAGSDPAPGRTVLLESRIETIVILPLNVTAALPEELEAASPIVWQELRLYLEAHGARLKTLPFPTARSLWIASVQEARAAEEVRGGRATFREAAPIFVAKVAPHAEFDSVIVPSLFVQGAKISGQTARWDGAERAVSIDEGLWAGQVDEDTPFGGAVPAASLHAVVLDGRGNVVQEGQSGLALLVGIRMAGRPELGAPRFEIVELADPFADREPIREGIARALTPFLSPLEPDQIPERAPPMMGAP